MSGYGVCFPHSTDDLGQAEVLYLQGAKSSHQEVVDAIVMRCWKEIDVKSWDVGLRQGFSSQKLCISVGRHHHLVLRHTVLV